MTNSRYEVRKYYVTYTDNREEAFAIANNKKIDAVWQEQFEIIDWSNEIGICCPNCGFTEYNSGITENEESAADQ